MSSRDFDPFFGLCCIWLSDRLSKRFERLVVLRIRFAIAMECLSYSGYSHWFACNDLLLFDFFRSTTLRVLAMLWLTRRFSRARVIHSFWFAVLVGFQCMLNTF